MDLNRISKGREAKHPFGCRKCGKFIENMSNRLCKKHNKEFIEKKRLERLEKKKAGLL